MGEKQKNKSMHRRIVRTIAILVVVVIGYKGIEVAKISRSLDHQIKEVTKEVALETKKLEELKIEYENIDSLHTVESMAREKLGYVKNDEIVFREKY